MSSYRHFSAASQFSVCLLTALLIFPALTARAAEKVKSAQLAIISTAPVYIAQEKGYFKEFGVESEDTSFASGAKMIPALHSGEIDVAGGGISAGLFNSLAEGSDIRIVADKGQFRPGYGFGFILVRKDLIDSGAVRSLANLKGKKFAASGRGANSEYFLAKSMEMAGLNYTKDLNLIFLDLPNQLTAFANKAIDASWANEPFGERAEQQGLAVRFLTADKVKGLEKTEVAVIFYSGKFIREKHNTAARWMKAYVRAVKYYSERSQKDPEIAAIISKYTKVPPEVVQNSIPFYLESSGRVYVPSIKEQQDWFHEAGMVKTKVDVDKYVDMSFLE